MLEITDLNVIALYSTGYAFASWFIIYFVSKNFNKSAKK